MAGPDATGSVRADQRQKALGAVAVRLTERFAQQLPAETIRGALEDAFDELCRRATVDTFLPILAERMAQARLMLLVRQSPIPDGVDHRPRTRC